MIAILAIMGDSQEEEAWKKIADISAFPRPETQPQAVRRKTWGA